MASSSDGILEWRRGGAHDAALGAFCVAELSRAGAGLSGQADPHGGWLSAWRRNRRGGAHHHAALFGAPRTERGDREPPRRDRHDGCGKSAPDGYTIMMGHVSVN